MSLRDVPQNKGHTDTENKGKNILCKWQWTIAGVTILISDQVDYEIKDIY